MFHSSSCNILFFHSNHSSVHHTWHLLSTGRIPERQVDQIREDLLTYCEQDTLAMVVLMDWAMADTSATHVTVNP